MKTKEQIEKEIEELQIELKKIQDMEMPDILENFDPYKIADVLIFFEMGKTATNF